MKIISVVGARLNIMKIAPFIKANNSYNAHLSSLDAELVEASPLITHLLVHTGQHYDDQMSK